MKRALNILIIAALLGVLPSGRENIRAEDVAREYLVKAAFLFNFAKFVEWPDDRFDSKVAPIELCIVGKNPFGEALKALAAKEIKGRSIEITSLPAIGDQDRCHIAFIAHDEKEDRTQALTALNNLSVLTVGDSAEFVSSGGVIEFKPVDNKIGFVINRSAANDSDLTISSKLLALAEEIR